jgi:predicted MFS family arabinose efflux permease
MASPLYPHISERSILLLVGAVQFVNILDFMMVMPLGPDFAPKLGIPTNDLGWIGGSYTAAAASAGVMGSLFIDKLDRKVALLAALLGLILATAFGGFAWDFRSLLISRIFAGLCGGPATSVAWSIVADTVEPARRGRAMGKVMGAFSLAAVFGVPFGLEMARLHNWATPFFVTAGLGALVMAMTIKLMPSMRAHLSQKSDPASLHHLWSLLVRPLNALTFLYILLAMLASFSIIPNISAYVQYNLHYPRAQLGWLYSAGGVVSFVTMRVTGRMIDRWSASFTSLISMLTYVFVLWIAFIRPVEGLPVMAIFILFMFAMGMRNVSSTTLATKIPSPQERAGFMSLLSCVQSVGMSLGAFSSTRMLTENADHSLNGMPRLALVCVGFSLFVPLLMRVVERRLTRPQ